MAIVSVVFGNESNCSTVVLVWEQTLNTMKAKIKNVVSI